MMPGRLLTISCSLCLSLACSGGKFSGAGGEKKPPAGEAANPAHPGAGSGPPSGGEATGTTTLACSDQTLTLDPQKIAATALDRLDVQVALRDFTPERHPDFENLKSLDRYKAKGEGAGVIKNLVKAKLDADGLPVFAGTAGDVITSAASFHQWYRDTPGVNERVPYSLQLKRVGQSNVFEAKEDNFFPLDKKGFGNQDNERNYHFTLHLTSKFTYLGGEVFRFKGDDDVWVFIDGSLQIDLGGVHGPEFAEIKLDELGFTAGSDHRLDLFYAERHVYGSTLHLETSLKLEAAYQAFQYDLSKHAQGGPVVSYEISGAPRSMKVDAKTGMISWAPDPSDIREYQVRVRLQYANCHTDGTLVLVP